MTTDYNEVKSLGNDQFIYGIDSKTASLQQIFLIIELDRANTLESQLQGEEKRLSQKNVLLETVSGHLGVLRESTIKEGSDDYDEWQKGEKNSKSFSSDITGFLRTQGVSIGKPDYVSFIEKKVAYKRENLEILTENVRALIDQLNSQSQLDLVRVSALVKQRDESFSAPAANNKSTHETNMAIIRGMKL